MAAFVDEPIESPRQEGLVAARGADRFEASDVTNEDPASPCESRSCDSKDPLAAKHRRIDSGLEFRVEKKRTGIRVCMRRVFIMDECAGLDFAKGVDYSESLLSNFPRLWPWSAVRPG